MLATLTLDSLRSAIDATPSNPTLRAVLADYLEECGEVETAAFWRWTVSANKYPKWDGRRFHDWWREEVWIGDQPGHCLVPNVMFRELTTGGVYGPIHYETVLAAFDDLARVWIAERRKGKA